MPKRPNHGSNKNWDKNKQHKQHGNNGGNRKNTPPKPEKEKVTPVTEDEADDIRVTVDLDDGSSVECMILTILEVSGRDYIALLPMDEKDQPNAAGEVYLFRYAEDDEGIPSIDNIADDDEYEAVYDAFDEWQDNELFDSM